MFLICLSLIGLVAIGVLTVVTPSTKTSAEYLPVPVRVNETKILRKKF
jgi:hypothetical protein